MDDYLFFYNNISEEAKSLLLGLIKADPTQRLSAHDALESAWMHKEFTDNTQKLNHAQKGALARKTMKQTRDSDPENNLERFSMGRLVKELTRYGIDFSRSGDGSNFHKSSSVVYRDSAAFLSRLK